jgi:hypothetical protein
MNYKAQRAPVPGVHYIVLTSACTWSADCYVTENSDTSNNDNTEYTFVNFRSVGFIRRIRPVRVPLTIRGLKVTPSLVRRAAPNKLHRYLSQNWSGTADFYLTLWIFRNNSTWRYRTASPIRHHMLSLLLVLYLSTAVPAGVIILPKFIPRTTKTWKFWLKTGVRMIRLYVLNLVQPYHPS